MFWQYLGKRSDRLNVANQTTGHCQFGHPQFVFDFRRGASEHLAMSCTAALRVFHRDVDEADERNENE